jgi:fatty acid desaturase
VKFTPDTLQGETKPQWYLRQMLGSANFRAGPVMAIMSGNLCYQIEHHLYPDLPSNRYAEIAQRVQEVCAKYGVPYTTGPLPHQYLLTLRTIIKLALPDRFLRATTDDAPRPLPRTDSPTSSHDPGARPVLTPQHQRPRTNLTVATPAL